MQKLKSSLNESLNETLNQRLQAKYPHLELAVLPLSQVKKDNEYFRIDSEPFKRSNLWYNFYGIFKVIYDNMIKLPKVIYFLLQVRVFLPSFDKKVYLNPR